jgi:glycosyltransferase involved in cell wall biosynthesis
MKPLVSILIPLYNAERWIAETLESTLAQTWQNKEIIVVNDGSTDNSLEIAKGYESNILKVISQDNQGCSAAKQTALGACQGEYIQYLDADDLLSPNKIKAQMSLLLRERHKVAVCRTIHFFEDEDYKAKPIEDEWYLYDTDDPVNFLIKLYGGDGQGGMIQPNAFLIPRTVAENAGSWNTSISPCPDEDGEYFCRIVLASSGIRFAPEAFNYYRKQRNGKSLSGRVSSVRMQNELRSHELIAEHLLASTSDPKAKKALARRFMDTAYRAYPDSPQVTSAALKKVKALGGTSYMPSPGGWRGHFLRRVFGWRLARRISTTSRRMLSLIIG